MQHGLDAAKRPCFLYVQGGIVYSAPCDHPKSNCSPPPNSESVVHCSDLQRMTWFEQNVPVLDRKLFVVFSVSVGGGGTNWILKEISTAWMLTNFKRTLFLISVSTSFDYSDAIETFV